MCKFKHVFSDTSGHIVVLPWYFDFTDWLCFPLCLAKHQQLLSFHSGPKAVTFKYIDQLFDPILPPLPHTALPSHILIPSSPHHFLRLTQPGRDTLTNFVNRRGSNNATVQYVPKLLQNMWFHGESKDGREGGVKKEYDLFIGIFVCLQRCSSCVAYRSYTKCVDCKCERLQSRILGVAVMPENATVSLSEWNVFVLRMTQCVPRCKHSPPRL